MKYIEAVEKLRKVKLENIYVIYGTESYLIESIIKKIMQKIATEDQTDNVSKYDLEEVSIQDVLLDVETYPFFGERKIVLAYHPIFLTAKPNKTGIDHDMESLLSYVQEPVDFSTLILVAPYEKLDERKKLTKLLKKNAMFIACEEIKAWHIDQWIDHMTKELKMSLEKPVYEMLVQESGTNLSLLQKELEKFALYVEENGKVTTDIADQLLSRQANTSGLKLVDAVIAKDLTRAIQIFKDLERMNEEVIALVALLAAQFRTIYQVKILKQKGYSQNQMAQQLKVHPYVVKMALEREKKFALDFLYFCLTACANTDSEIKQGKSEKTLAFEMLLYQLINK
ncbi:DNA polymerase-3 subunit delta [Natronobacillus azotifigens]|uniref:DNA polymerase III subunit delta n=1 Tax=Natronobacillus azotifigens TaxID=472978 RepID=A0A9J6RF51_9BACI|nr:DNA polymerase III subunit delta [Natronobacillus azotifigens]MCZ0704004.1 DNA polymerase III subunit delta [Natronobacillus azotifigens]